jgi:hypothetical protein
VNRFSAFVVLAPRANPLLSVGLEYVRLHLESEWDVFLLLRTGDEFRSLANHLGARTTRMSDQWELRRGDKTRHGTLKSGFYVPCSGGHVRLDP